MTNVSELVAYYGATTQPIYTRIDHRLHRQAWINTAYHNYELVPPPSPEKDLRPQSASTTKTDCIKFTKTKNILRACNLRLSNCLQVIWNHCWQLCKSYLHHWFYTAGDSYITVTGLNELAEPQTPLVQSTAFNLVKRLPGVPHLQTLLVQGLLHRLLQTQQTNGWPERAQLHSKRAHYRPQATISPTARI